MSLARQPLRFEPTAHDNAKARFVARRGGAELAIGDDSSTLKLGRATSAKHAELTLTVPGHNAVKPVVSSELPTKVTYAHGTNSNAWRKDVATFSRATYPSIVDGIDLVFHGEEGQVEYDFVVAPHADAARAALRIDGVESLAMTPSGELAMKTAGGTLLQHKPHAFQRAADGVEHEVVAAFRLVDSKTVAFDVGAYDHEQPLVIDPVIGYATYLGGAADETLNAITSDASGNVYVVGSAEGDDESTSPDIAGTTHLHGDGYEGAEHQTSDSEIFVAKLDSTGALANILYVGGDGDDYGTGIALDASGAVVISGYTSSYDFPVKGSGASTVLQGSEDALLLKVNSSFQSLDLAAYVDVGSVGCSGEYSGEATCTDEYGYAIAVSGDTAYLAGEMDHDYQADTSGEAADYGAFVVALPLASDNTTPIFTQFFTTFDYSSADGVATDAAGNVYVVGSSADDTLNGFTTNGARTYQPSRNGFYSAFLAELSPGASPSTPVVTYATYLDGSGNSNASGVAVSGTGNVFVVGATSIGGKETESVPESVKPLVQFPPPGIAFPVKNQVQPTSQDGEDAFVANFNTNVGGDASLIYSTAIGGAQGDDFGTAIAVDGQGNAYVTGGTYSSDFPTTPLAEHGTDGDAFFVEIAPGAGSNGVQFAITYGGSNYDVGNAITVGSKGLYAAGQTSSTDFTPHSAAQSTFGGGVNDGFILYVKVQPLSLTPSVATVAPQSTIRFDAEGGSGAGYQFTLSTNASGGSIDNLTGVYTAGTTPGADVVTVKDITGVTAIATVNVQKASAVILTPSTASAAPRGGVQFSATGGAPPYIFSFSSNASGGTIGGSTGGYIAGARGPAIDTVRVTDATGQTALATVAVGAALSIDPTTASTTTRGTVQFTASGGSGGSYSWSTTDGDITPTGLFTAPTSLGIVTVTVHDGLGSTASVNVSVGGALAIAQVNPTTYPLGTLKLTAFGGTGKDYVWHDVTSPAVGGSINASTGVFTAGPTPNVDENIEVTDGLGNHAVVTIKVGAGVSITPSTATVAAHGTVTFGAAGGSGEGYAYSITTNATGATIDPTGAYVAGAVGGVDTVKLVDSVGNEADATVTVTAPSTPPPGGSSSSGGSAPPVTNPPVSSSSSSSGGIKIGSSGGGGDDCAVSNVGSSSSTGASLGLVGFAVLALARRRRMRR